MNDMVQHSRATVKNKITGHSDGIESVQIPPAKRGKPSRYEQYLDAALRTTDGEGIQVPVPTSARSTISGLYQLIGSRGLPIRVIQRGESVYIARREN